MGAQYEALTYWQKQGIELTDSLCQYGGATLFTPYPIFSVSSTYRTRIHELSQASKQIDALNRNQTMLTGMWLIGPGKRVIADCTDKLFNAAQGSTIVCCFPENDDATLVRPVAIARFVDHIPCQCIPYVSEIKVENIHALDGSLIHFMQISLTKAYHPRIQLPIKARPLVLTPPSSNNNTPRRR